MKHKKNFKYTLPVLLLLWLAFSMSSCIREELVGETGRTDYSAVSISVQMPAPIATNPMTRAALSDFDQMTDINLFIAKDGRDLAPILSRVYFNFAEVENGEIINGTTITYTDVKEDGTNTRKFKLYFPEDYLSSIKDINLNECYFYAVANWGDKITESLASDVDALKKLTAKTISIGGNSYIQTPNVMFGKSKADNPSTEPIPDSDTPGAVCRRLLIGLERTAAMVTVRVDGTGLGDNIVITPKKISLHNVPTECTLGPNYIVPTVNNDGRTPVENRINLNGDSKDGLALSGIGTEVKLVNGAQKAKHQDDPTYNTSVGGHYLDENGNEDYTITGISPLFLYENTHAPNFGEQTNDDQKWKRPSDVDKTITAIENNTKTCSYLEVEGEYIEYQEDDLTQISQKGTVSWRFFLGSDELKNFDVKRNHCYRIDLMLSGTSISELQETWRVMGTLKEAVIIGETDMVVGGGGEAFCVEFINDKTTMKIAQNPDATFVYVYTKPKSEFNWIPVSEIGNGATHTSDEYNQTWFYVSPFLPETPWDGDERSCSVSFTDNSGNNTYETITFTQYRPIKIEVTPTDVADKDDADMQEIKNLITTYYNCNFDGGESFVMYIDRVDRNPMPWGFDGIEIDHNHHSGFENVYHLIDPKEPVTQICLEHQTEAIHYLPTGKGYRDTPGGYIDYSKGSCMMHAAMENHFQQYDPCPPKDLSPDDLYKTTDLPKRPGSHTDQNHSYGWCVPSIVGWQLLEKLDRHYREHVNGTGIFDPKYPIIPFYSYWTSNAGAKELDTTVYPDAGDGDKYSFVYQFDMGLDKITPTHPYGKEYLVSRSTAVRYRLINIDPKYLKDLPNGEDPDPDPLE